MGEEVERDWRVESVVEQRGWEGRSHVVRFESSIAVCVGQEG